MNFDKFVRRALTGFEIEPKQASSSQADYRKSDHRCHRSQSGISELTSEFENSSKVFLFTFDKLLVFFQGLPSWPMLALPPGLQQAAMLRKAFIYLVIHIPATKSDNFWKIS